MNMKFYYWEESGKIIVQNALMGFMGQKHEHTPEDFVIWSKDIPKEDLIKLPLKP